MEEEKIKKIDYTFSNIKNKLYDFYQKSENSDNFFYAFNVSYTYFCHPFRNESFVTIQICIA